MCDWSSKEEYLVASVLIDLAPPRDYVDFTSYSHTVAPHLQASPFELVICDGPPGSTRGGRYGLVPVMRWRRSDIHAGDSWIA